MEQAPECIQVFSLVRQHRRMLANMNYYLNRQSRILDFGCGEGRYVYEYRDAGFDAYGFDIRPAVNLRSPEDRRYFGYALTGKPANIPDYEVHATSYKIPFEDECFDFVFSNSTLEHVRNYDLAFSEISRVLRKGSISIHVFPPRWRLIESHIYVPLGGVIQKQFWYLLWACMGIRNQYQTQMNARECAANNVLYARTGLNYPRTKDIRRIGQQYFREVDFIPRLWELGDKGFTTVKGAFLGAPVLHRYARWIYTRFYNVVLFLRK